MLQVPLGWRETSLWGGRQDLAPQGTCWPNGTTRAEYLLSKKIPFKKKFSLSSLQISLKMWTGKGWSRYLHLCLQRIDLKKKIKEATHILNTSLKQQHRSNVCGGRRGKKDTWESDVMPRDVLGSPPWGWDSLHPQHPLSTRNELVVLKKEKQNKNPITKTKELGLSRKTWLSEMLLKIQIPSKPPRCIWLAKW